MNQGAILVDIRASDEHARERIALAHHVPMERLKNGLLVRKKEMPSLPYFLMRILVLVLSMMTEGLIWTVPILAISMPCLTDCS